MSSIAVAIEEIACPRTILMLAELILLSIGYCLS